MTHVFKEYLENTTSLFIDQTRDTLHTTTTRQTTDGRLSDTYLAYKGRSREGYSNPQHTLNVVPKDLTMALGTALSETLRRNKSDIV